MNYISGTKFKFTPKRKIPSALSENFVEGRTYELSHVTIIKEESKLEYSFVDLFDNNVIKRKFANVGEGDDFIANLSGQTHELAQARKAHNDFVTSEN